MFTQSLREVFDTFYADNFAPEDTLQDLIYGPSNAIPVEYQEAVTGLTRERLIEMWEIMRYKADSADRVRPGYQKFQRLAELAQFSALADKLVGDGFFSDGADG